MLSILWRFHHGSNYTIRRRRFLRPTHEEIEGMRGAMTKQPFRRIDRIVAAANWPVKEEWKGEDTGKLFFLLSDNTRGNEFPSLFGWLSLWLSVWAAWTTRSSPSSAGAFPGDGFERLVKHVKICTTYHARSRSFRTELQAASRFDYRFLRFSEKESFGRRFLESFAAAVKTRKLKLKSERGNYAENRSDFFVESLNFISVSFIFGNDRRANIRILKRIILIQEYWSVCQLHRYSNHRVENVQIRFLV